MSKPWNGKQLWLWEDLPPAPEIIAQAKQLGLAGLLVKGWDGTDSAGWLPQVEAVVGPAHAAGLVVGAWGYCYGVDPAGEAAAAKACLDAGAAWLVLDVEKQFEDRPYLVAGMERAFRPLKDAGVLIGYSSFGLPALHPGFPWAQFSAWCDVAVPQVYWADWQRSVAEAISESLAQTSPYGLPVAPAGQVITDSGAAVLSRDVVAFGAQALAAGCPGISFWRAGGDVQADALAAVEAIKWEVIPVPKPEQWQLDIIQKAKAEGLIKDDHDPLAPMPTWMGLQIMLNLRDECVLKQNGAQK